MNNLTSQRRLRPAHLSHKASRMAAVLLSLLCAAWCTSTVQAQDVPCDLNNVGDDFPCSFQSEAVALQKVPAIFKFQSRISQAKLPLGEAVFQTVFVNILRGNEAICREQFANVTVHNSTMNLEIGSNMSCELDEVIAENSDLAFQVCLGGLQNCLRPLKLAASPYAIKSSFASQAQNAHQADIAGQAHYAHRITADRDLLFRNKLGTGYFDFYTHPADSVDALYNAADYLEYAQSGFIQWTPTSPDGTYAIHIVAKDPSTDELRMLEHFIVASEQSIFRGGIEVDTGGAQIVGESTIEGDTTIAGLLLMGHDPESLIGATDRTTHGIDGQLQVTGATFINQGGAHVIGDSNIQGKLAVGQAESTYQLDVSGDINFTGQLRRNGEILAISGAQWEGNQTLDLYYEQGNIGINTQDPGFDLDVVGDINFTGQLRRNGEAVALSPWSSENGNISYAGGVAADNFTATNSGSFFQDIQIGAEGTGFSRGSANLRNTGEQTGLRFSTSVGTPSAILSDNGNFTTAGDLSTHNIAATGGVTAESLITTGDVTAENITATGNVAVDGNFLPGNITASGDIATDSNLTVAGTAQLGELTLNHPDLKFGLNEGRGDGGRALVHDSNDTLVLNFGGDFSGATEIQSDLRVTGSVIYSHGQGNRSGELYGYLDDEVTLPTWGVLRGGLRLQVHGNARSHWFNRTGDAVFEGNVFAENINYRGSSTQQSDERIKNIQGISDGTEDLQMLRALQVTNYTFRDQRIDENRPQKMLIAQQVAKVYTQAVRTSEGVVPDILSKSKTVKVYKETITVDLPEPHNLQKGDRVMIELGQEGRTVKVISISSPTSFKATGWKDGDISEVFVYGRHVEDFHSVDYNAVAMLNVSATQELARRLEDLQNEVSELRNENHTLRQKFTDLNQLREDLEAVRAACNQD